MEKTLNIVIGGLQKHQAVKTNGICTCLCSGMGAGGGITPMVVVESDDETNRRMEQKRCGGEICLTLTVKPQNGHEIWVLEDGDSFNQTSHEDGTYRNGNRGGIRHQPTTLQNP